MSKTQAIALCNEYKDEGDKHLVRLFPQKNTKLSEMFSYIINQADN